MKKFNYSKGLLVGLLTLALCIASIGPLGGSIGAAASGTSTSASGTATSAATTTPAASQVTAIRYDSKTDSVEVTTDHPGTVYLYAAKESSGATLKSKSFKASVTTTSASGETTAKGKISLTDKNLKVAINKDGYIIATVTKPTSAEDKDGGKSFTPSLEIKKTPYKKVAVNVDYAKAEKGGTELAIASIEITPTEGEKYTLTPSSTNWNEFIQMVQFTDVAKPTATTVWYDVKAAADAQENGASAAESGESASGTGATVGTSGNLPLVSADGTAESTSGTSNSASSTSGTATVTLTPAGGFTTGYVYQCIQAKKGAKLTFRVGGVEGTGTGNNAGKRGSKEFKVNLKGAAAAQKKLSVNVATNAVVIKNGFDFFVATSASSEPTIDEAYTVLPAKDGGTDVDGFLKVNEYVPYKKPADNGTESAKMFTSKDNKIKEISFETIKTLYNIDVAQSNVYVWVRKSAAVGKPASLWKQFEIKKQAAAPTVSLSGETTIATQDAKGALKGTFSPAASEILVVNAADIDKIAQFDWSKTKWTKYAASKGIKEGTKSKYKVGTGDVTTAELAEGSFVLVRVAGDKKSNKLPSAYVKTKITKSGDKLVWTNVDGVATGSSTSGTSTSASGTSTSGSSNSGNGT